MDEALKAKISEWLREKRGGRSYVVFAGEMGVAKSSLQRYETGETNPPAALVVEWQARFTDFPRLGYAGDVGPAEGIRVDIEKITRISDTLDALFAEVALDKKRHRPFRNVLFSIMERDTISRFSLVQLAQWYCDEVVNATADA